MELDLISVGSDGGGLAAAIAASDAGLRAIVLEKAPRVGVTPLVIWNRVNGK